MTTNLLTIFALAAPVLAQTTVKDALVKHWKTSGEFTIAVAYFTHTGASPGTGGSLPAGERYQAAGLRVLEAFRRK
jgi:hypothetical protein